MRGGEHAGAITCMSVNRLQESDGASLAVCAGDMDKLEALVRMIEKFKQFTGLFKAHFGAEDLQAIEPIDRFLVLHTEETGSVYRAVCLRPCSFGSQWFFLSKMMAGGYESFEQRMR